MSELRSAIDSLRAEVLAELPDQRVEEDFAELQRAMDQLEVERLRRLAELDRRRHFHVDGFLSTASWLASAFKMAWGADRQRVREARALEEMPETRRALEEGEISWSAVQTLVTARDTDRNAFRDCEKELVEAARIHSMGDLQRIAGYWRQAVEQEQALDGEEKLRARRRLHASVTFSAWSASTEISIPRPAKPY